VNQKDAWNTVVKAAKAIADAIVDALNALIEWVVGIFKQAINAVIKPIMDAMKNMAMELFQALYDGFFQNSGTDKNNIGIMADGDTGRNYGWMNIFFESQFFINLMVVVYVIYGAWYTAAAIIKGFSSVASTLTDVLLKTIAKNLLLSLVAGLALSEISKKISEGSEIFTKWVFSQAGYTEEDEFFYEGLGLAITGAVASGFSYLSAKVLTGMGKITLKPGEKLDLGGLRLAIIGIVVCLFGGFFTTQEMISDYGVIALSASSIFNIMGVILAGWGMIGTLGEDPLDTVFGVFGLFEETISIVSFGYALASTSESLYLLFKELST